MKDVTTTTPKSALEIADKAREYIAKSKAPNTRRAYRADWRDFEIWCKAHSFTSLPGEPETVALYLTALAETLKPSTLARRLAAIAKAHQTAGHESPTRHEAVRAVMSGIRREKGSRRRQATAITYDMRCRMIAAAGDKLIGLRDKALLSVAYDTLGRRSELVAIDLAHVAYDDDSGTVLIERSKTDQSGEGSVQFIAPDTVEFVKRWIEAAGITEGALFRAVGKGGAVGVRLWPDNVPHIYRAMAKRAGLDTEGISGHSTRVGAAQDLTAAGFGLAEIMQNGRWKTAETLMRYTEHLQARRGAMAKLAVLQNRS